MAIPNPSKLPRFFAQMPWTFHLQLYLLQQKKQGKEIPVIFGSGSSMNRFKLGRSHSEDGRLITDETALQTLQILILYLPCMTEEQRGYVEEGCKEIAELLTVSTKETH